MHTLVRKILETYLREQRVLTLSDIDSSFLEYTKTQLAVFVTLYYQWKVVASSGRIQCKKENTLFECIDNTLMCLKDPRFTSEIQNPETLSDIRIRVDTFGAPDRRLLQNISELNTRDEWLLFLSQNFGKMAIILPKMLHLDSAPENYFALICQKAWLDRDSLQRNDYVIYWIKTLSISDF